MWWYRACACVLTPIHEQEAHNKEQQEDQPVSMAQLFGLAVGAAFEWRCCCFEIDATKLLAFCDFEVHQARYRDAVVTPVAHAGWGDSEDAGHRRRAAERVNNLSGKGIYASILAKANDLEDLRKHIFC